MHLIHRKFFYLATNHYKALCHCDCHSHNRTNGLNRMDRMDRSESISSCFNVDHNSHTSRLRVDRTSMSYQLI